MTNTVENQLMKGAAPVLAHASVTEALDYLPYGVAVVDDADRIRYCNQHVVNIFPCLGPDASGLLGCHFRDLAACKIENGLTGHCNGLYDTEALLAHRMSLHRNPGRPVVELPLADGRWIEVTETPIPNAGLTISWIDITARKRTQMQLEDAIVSTTDGYAVWNKNEQLQSCNRRFAELMAGLNRTGIEGLTLREVLERSMANRIFKAFPAPTQWLIDREEDHRSGNSQAILESTDGRWFRITNSRTRDGCISTILCDVSDQYETDPNDDNQLAALEEATSRLDLTEQQLQTVSGRLDKALSDVEQADASKTAFLRNMSHELRTPLNSIIGFAELLKRELYGPLNSAEYGECAGHIQTSGEHLLNLINRILDLSKLEAGRYVIYPERLSLPAIVEEAAARLSAEAAAKPITLDISMDMALPEVFADKNAILQAITNLLDNAIKFTRAGGNVYIAGSSADSGVRLEIVDSGIGIDHTDIDRFTLPFERCNNSLAENTQGCGLGLPIAKSLITLQGGTMAIASEPHKGTKVAIWLPQADLVAAAVGDGQNG